MRYVHNIWLHWCLPECRVLAEVMVWDLISAGTLRRYAWCIQPGPREPEWTHIRQRQIAVRKSIRRYINRKNINGQLIDIMFFFVTDLNNCMKDDIWCTLKGTVAHSCHQLHVRWRAPNTWLQNRDAPISVTHPVMSQQSPFISTYHIIPCVPLHFDIPHLSQALQKPLCMSQRTDQQIYMV